MKKLELVVVTASELCRAINSFYMIMLIWLKNNDIKRL